MKNENQLIEEKPSSPVEKFVSQLSDPLTYVLFAAAAISFFLKEYGDLLVILVVVVFNGVMGVIQEGRAEQALAVLKKMSSPMATVRIQGQIRQIPAVNLSVGDVVLLEAGSQIPADLKLTEARHLFAEESALTGESLPVAKHPGDPAFMSTLVTGGRGEGVVTAIGMNTEIGRIAAMLRRTQPEPTPLQQRLGRLGKTLSILVVVLCLLLFLISLSTGRDLGEMLITSISLAVAAVPEGLPAIVTVVLAMGVGRLARAGTIVRKLPSVETLGSVTVVCSDKTGTLTQNRMTVTTCYVSGKTYPAEDPHIPRELLEGFCLCNDALRTASERLGDPTELALLDWAARHQLEKESLVRRYPRIDEIPFSSQAKSMTTVHRFQDQTFSLQKGAPDVILKNCTALWMSPDTPPVSLTPGHRAQLEAAIEKLSSQGLRLLALARDQIFLGLVGMKDPIRPESLPAVRNFRQAGVRTLMITGDHPATAQAIARELELIPEGNSPDAKKYLLTGAELDCLSDERLRELVRHVRVFARVSPTHKVRIVKALQANGELVAMTGDGVNDAPSLKQANIGVAMGNCGTDVAKEAADMILTDDNFATIRQAISGGRSLYENIRKSVLFLLSSNFGEVMTMFTAVLCGLAVPLRAIHILWVNLLTDSLPALALGMDQNDEESLMRRPPRPPEESLMAHGGWFCTIFYGGLIAAISLAAYLVLPVLALREAGLPLTLSHFKILLADPALLIRAQTYAFTTLGISQLFHAMGMRDPQISFFAMKHRSNPLMLLAFFTGLSLQIAVTQIPFLNHTFGTVPLALHEWGFLLALSATPVFAHQLLVLTKKY